MISFFKTRAEGNTSIWVFGEKINLKYVDTKIIGYLIYLCIYH